MNKNIDRKERREWLRNNPFESVKETFERKKRVEEWMENERKRVVKLIEDYEYLKELVESKSMVSQLSESTQGYLLEYFGIRNTEDLSDKCDEVEKEIETNKYSKL